MLISKKVSRPERGSWRMGTGAVLGFIGMIGLGNGSLIGLALLLIAVALVCWGAQRAFVGPTLPRVADVLKRTAFRLAGVLERLACGLRK